MFLLYLQYPGLHLVPRHVGQLPLVAINKAGQWGHTSGVRGTKCDYVTVVIICISVTCVSGSKCDYVTVVIHVYVCHLCQWYKVWSCHCCHTCIYVCHLCQWYKVWSCHCCHTSASATWDRRPHTPDMPNVPSCPRHHLAITHKLGEETLWVHWSGVSSGNVCIHPRDWAGHLNRDERWGIHMSVILNGKQCDYVTMLVEGRRWRSSSQNSSLIKTTNSHNNNWKLLNFHSTLPLTPSALQLKHSHLTTQTQTDTHTPVYTHTHTKRKDSQD